jgi:L-seryl-tRNA(Ser) seleniumtransferase
MPDYRIIPSIEQIRQTPAIQPLMVAYGHDAVVNALREEAEVLRQRLASGDALPDPDAAVDAIVAGAARRLSSALMPSLRRVLNATGVIVHTNLGRAPLATSAAERLRELAGYSNLEYDLAGGHRGSRDVHAEPLICRITGAEAAVVVNNCAAAALLVLTALARGREVLVSRGELVEIGGGFRVPDVMTQSGARLREVGTTNRTRVSDYALAISERTGAILRVHPSNFRMEGFTQRPTIAELVMLGRAHDVPVIEDLGSGLLSALDEPRAEALRNDDPRTDRASAASNSALASEPTVTASIAAGVGVVCFSGDKLLGGPQAGVIVGRRALVERVRRHPLMRALRVDKLTYAALEATLVEHATGRASETVPVLRMATLPVEAIAVRAETLAARLRRAGFGADVIDGVSTVGGGSAPGSALPTRMVALERHGWSATQLESELHALNPPVIARIEHDRVVLDLRTIAPSDDEELSQLLTTLAPGP